MKLSGEDFLKNSNVTIKKETISYNKDGVMIIDSCASDEICCQYVKYEDREVYYIMQDTYKNLYNPTDEVANRRRNISYKMRTVGEKCFMKYLDFLTHKKELDFLKANKICKK